LGDLLALFYGLLLFLFMFAFLGVGSLDLSPLSLIGLIVLLMTPVWTYSLTLDLDSKYFLGLIF